MTLGHVQSAVKILITAAIFLVAQTAVAIPLTAADYYIDNDVHIVRLREYDGDTPWFCAHPGKSLHRKLIDFKTCTYDLIAPGDPIEEHITCNGLPADWIVFSYWLPSFQNAPEFTHLQRPPLPVLHLVFIVLQGYVKNIGFSPLFEPEIKPPPSLKVPRFIYAPDYSTGHFQTVIDLTLWTIKDRAAYRDFDSIDSAIREYSSRLTNTRQNPHFEKVLNLLLYQADGEQIQPPYPPLTNRTNYKQGLLTMLLRWHNEVCQLTGFEKKLQALHIEPTSSVRSCTRQRDLCLADIAWHLSMPLVRLQGYLPSIVPASGADRHENRQLYQEYLGQAIYYLDNPSFTQLYDILEKIRKPVLLLYVGEEELLMEELRRRSKITSFKLQNIPVSHEKQLAAACFIYFQQHNLQKFLDRIPKKYLHFSEAPLSTFQLPSARECTSRAHTMGHLVTGQRPHSIDVPSPAIYRTHTACITELDKTQVTDEPVNHLSPVQPFHSPFPQFPAPTLTPSQASPDGDRTPLASGSPTPVFLPKQITPEPQP